MANLPPEGGGGTEFSGEYELISSQPTVEIVGTQDVQDVQEIVARALPSNVVFTLRFLPEAYVPELVSSLTSQFAGYFNAAMGIPGVAAVSTFQDVNHADQLEDVMQFVVLSTSGKTTFPLVETPLGLSLETVAADVAATRSNLDAIESGH